MSVAGDASTIDAFGIGHHRHHVAIGAGLKVAAICKELPRPSYRRFDDFPPRLSENVTGARCLFAAWRADLLDKTSQRRYHRSYSVSRRLVAAEVVRPHFEAILVNDKKCRGNRYHVEKYR